MTTIGCHVASPPAVHGRALPLSFLYPASGDEQTIAIGPYDIIAAPEAEPLGAARSLIVISHGNGGTPWAHRDLARHLALQGDVVAMPEHVGNSRSDNTLEGRDEVLLLRPAQLSAAIDEAFKAPKLALLLNGRIALVGTSIGAYTALAVAGGKPWTGGRQKPYQLDVTQRDDIGALVLLSPAAGWYLPEKTLDGVSAAVLIRNGAHDELAPPWHAETILKRLPPSTVTSHECVEGAGHFSFMSQFPPALAHPGFAPAYDPEGFDRVGYQKILHDDISAFLAANLR